MSTNHQWGKNVSFLKCPEVPPCQISAPHTPCADLAKYVGLCQNLVQNLCQHYNVNDLGWAWQTEHVKGFNMYFKLILISWKKKKTLHWYLHIASLPTIKLTLHRMKCWLLAMLYWHPVTDLQFLYIKSTNLVNICRVLIFSVDVVNSFKAAFPWTDHGANWCRWSAPNWPINVRTLSYYYHCPDVSGC